MILPCVCVFIPVVGGGTEVAFCVSIVSSSILLCGVAIILVKSNLVNERHKHDSSCVHNV